VILGENQYVMVRAGEPELEPNIFSGGGAFLNISCGAGAGLQNIYQLQY